MPGPSAWAARGARSTSAAKKAKKAKARKGPQPKLLLPAEDAEFKPGKVTFKWRVVAKRVRLEVARDEEFTDIAVDRPVNGRQAALLLEPGTYYWRVTGPRGMPSDPRMLTVAATPEPELEPQPQPQSEPQPVASEGLGLDLTGATPSSTTSEAAPSEATALSLNLSETTQVSAEVPSGSIAPKEPTESVVAEAERTPSSSQSSSKKRWSLFVGGSAAYGASAPHSMATLRYEASVAYRLANPFELSLGVGGTSIQALGTRDASWPYYTWIGQVYADLGGRFRLARFGNAALYGLVAGRFSLFTGEEEHRGFLVDRGPFSAGAGLAYRFRAGLPLELGLRGNLLTGNKLGGELELGLRVLIF
ncbi:hypothetical protein [Archangium lansingense]|uniref:Outer membrane protein beta-barrel domain-containing protein n=1 Tax=Archangium lansingense TaxID=2995310 RepID=A0ABT4AH36_9BACT|nr:hypothetical protein [Archangium lansinium]MCY1080997.1 hypothetical protein [Archangium lansinium]